MNKIIGAITTAAIIIVGLISLVVCTERIPAGYVGVIYSMNGGVEDTTIPQGWHIVSPSKKVYEFSVGNEQLILSKDSREGSDDDESFFVATSDNANIAVSFQMSYRFDEGEVVKTFNQFKGMDGEDIVRGRVRTVLKAKISEVTKNYSMMELYSGSRDKINAELTDSLNSALHSQFGIEIIDASIIDVHPDAALQQTINNRVAALQKKQQAEAEQETIKVQNETKLMQAKADAEEKRIIAEGNADVTRINSQAQADGHKILVQNLTPELIKKLAVDKWDGHLPTTIGSDAILNAIG